MQLALTTPVKDKYKLRNWKNYNKNLCHRGSLSLYISDSVLREWRDIDKCKKVVGEKTYTESIILCCLLLKMQYSQPLRQTTGFVKSLLSLAGCRDFSIPDYTTLCRRQGCVPMSLTKRWESGEKLALAVDSTGLKTSNDKDDAEMAVEMLKDKVDKVESFHGDGAYDDFKCRKLFANAKQIIPPPKDAVIHQASKRKPLKEYLSQRNKAVEFINKHDRMQWKIKEGYHLRSRNETTMFRYKTAFGGEIQARKIENQKTEVLLKSKILNIYRDVGMPMAYRVV